MAGTTIASRGEKPVKQGKFVKKHNYDLVFIEMNKTGEINFPR